MSEPWVVKLGGSLMQSRYLSIWLERLQHINKNRVIIVPGGGIFADHIRQLQKRWQFDDTVAHQLALRAMEQYGQVLQSLAPALTIVKTQADIESVVERRCPAIWFPYNMVAVNTDLEPGWDITSDSLALWLAARLQYRNLLLVKSVLPDDQDYAATSLSARGYLDRAFARMLSDTPINVWWLSSGQYERLDDLFATDKGMKKIHSVTAC